MIKIKFYFVIFFFSFSINSFGIEKNCPTYGHWYDRIGILKGPKDIDKFGVDHLVDLCVKYLEKDYKTSSTNKSKKFIKFKLASVAQTINDKDQYPKKFFEDINFLINNIGNDNPDVQMFFLIGNQTEIYKYDFLPAELKDIFINTAQMIEEIIEPSRLKLFKLFNGLGEFNGDSLSAFEKFELSKKTLKSINYYTLPTEIEKVLYLSEALWALDFDKSDLEKYVKLFLYHFPENQVSFISRYEMDLYGMFAYALGNSDLSGLSKQLHKKYFNRSGLKYNEFLEGHYGYTFNFNSITTLLLNFSSYDLRVSPYKKDELFELRLQNHSEVELLAVQAFDSGVWDSLEKTYRRVAYDYWLSDTANHLNFLDHGQEACKKALEFYDVAFDIYKVRKNLITLNEDNWWAEDIDMSPYTEPLYAANCALTIDKPDLAISYLDLSEEFDDLTKDLRDKFDELIFPLIRAKILTRTNQPEEAFSILRQINEDIFKSQFIDKPYLSSENFDFAISIYTELYKFFQQDQYDVSNMRHPIEWLDLRYAFLENTKIINTNLSSSNSQINNLQLKLKNINEEIKINETKFLRDKDQSSFDALERLTKDKKINLEKILSANSRLKNFVTPELTHFKKFRESLKDDQYILAYHFGRHQSSAFLVSKTETKIHILDINSSEASHNFQVFNSEISDNNFKNIPLSATLLYRKYFEKILFGIEDEATIFLYGTEFDHIPMNALSVGYKKSDSDYQQMITSQWLIKKFKFAQIEPFYSYESSSKFKKKFLGVANPQISSKLNLPYLPSAESEVLRLAITSGASREDLLMGENATFKDLKNKLSESYERIVFATHAITSNDIDDTQRLILGNPETEDQIYVSDIINLNISSDLVILSSCFPGKRNMQLFSLNQNPPLSRAFLLSGTNSVISTTWNVETAVSSRITNLFFEYTWDDSEVKKFEALRNANLEVLYDYSKTENISPMNWANFKITYKDHYSL